MSSDKENNAYRENTAVGRIARYGKVSGTMAGLAARVIGERYLGLEIERGKHAEDLVAALGNLKGPLMKVGQILSTIPEALPPEYAQAFERLQSNAPPMSWAFVRRRMRAELGADWQSKFIKFDKEASAAASLGQVHKAKGKNSLDLACKLQYPDMHSVIEVDLKQLKIIFSVYRTYDSSIRTEDIYEELKSRLREELDYSLEARYTKLYAFMLAQEAGVHVPAIVEELSTDRLLTSTWLEGKKILTYKEASQDVRDQLALNMFRAWYVPFYSYGTIHGDPHLGNYTVREDLSINLLDFGCVRVFPPRFVGGVIDLYNALQGQDKPLAVHAFETWGFEGLSNEQVDTLMIWAGFLYGPLLEDKRRPIGEVTEGIYGRDTAEKVHKKLRELSKQSGGIKIPREFVFMDRAALGLGSVFLHLRSKVNWYRLFNELISGFDVDVLQKRQAQALGRFSLKKDGD